MRTSTDVYKRQEEILLIIIVSHSTELHMLAAVIIHLLVLHQLFV